ncbi:hypothetical protein AVEN_193267-1 [Araneus ventricosus]|uniref:Uncharacterized protein n=1 Tax=Araneus ventricosus TaxID=182803 RepID=A0A4Y2MF41_ARAVE|nr:hypothetical protein AVEN_193267-1 [Araneus ventricosus]
MCSITKTGVVYFVLFVPIYYVADISVHSIYALVRGNGGVVPKILSLSTISRIRSQACLVEADSGKMTRNTRLTSVRPSHSLAQRTMPSRGARCYGRVHSGGFRRRRGPLSPN